MKEGEMTSEEQRLPERGLTSLSQGINSGSSLNLNPPHGCHVLFIHLFMLIHIFDVMKPVTLSYPYGDSGSFHRDLQYRHANRC